MGLITTRLETMKMASLIEMGTVSSRGQICVPNNIREIMGLAEGSKVLFVLQDDALLMKKVTLQTFAQITKPLKEAARKAGMKESRINRVIAVSRKSNHEDHS